MAAPTPSLQWCISRWSTSLEEGSIRHDDDGRPAPSAGSPVSEGRGVFHLDDYRIESIQVGIIEVVDTDDDYDDD